MDTSQRWTLRLNIDAQRGDVVASLIEARHRNLRWGVATDVEACWYSFEHKPALGLIDAIGAWLAGLGAADAALTTSGPDGKWRSGWRGWWIGVQLSPRFAVALPGSAPLPDVAHTLYLEPGGGFGSGHHPTTRLAMALLDASLGELEPGSLLDVGCGTGVLSIAAATLGWGTLGVDSDGHAVQSARQHALHNSVDHRCSWQHGTLEANTPLHDVVVANMPGGCLMDLGPLLAATAGRELILSGADAGTRSRIVDAVTPWRVMHEETDGEWVGMRLRRA